MVKIITMTDMGLGKTLQTICILASDQHYRAARFKETQAADSRPLPSLVVCPTSVTGHWKHEIETYTDNLSAMIYSGSPSERRRYVFRVYLMVHVCLCRFHRLSLISIALMSIAVLFLILL